MIMHVLGAERETVEPKSMNNWSSNRVRATGTEKIGGGATRLDMEPADIWNQIR